VRDSERDERRAVVRRQQRQQRLIALIVGVGCLSFLLFYFVVLPRLGGSAKQPAPPPVAVTSPSPSPPPAASSPEPTPTATPVVAQTEPAKATPPKQPHIVQKPIAFGAERRKQMAAYSRERYGDSSIVLKPKVVVLHYTAGGSWQSAWSLFDSNAPNMGNPGDLPGTVTHFIIDKDGTIYQLIPLDLRGRHTIGLNHVALGIEFVEEGSGGDTAAVRHIFHRKAQIDAGLKLVRWLQYRFHIQTRDVIGHGTADDSRYFKDLTGLSNDHGDWGTGPVRLFQKRLRELAVASRTPKTTPKATPEPAPDGTQAASPGASPSAAGAGPGEPSASPPSSPSASSAASGGAPRPAATDEPTGDALVTPRRAAGAVLLVAAAALLVVVIVLVARRRPK